jgi:hypothetical protein
MTTQPSTHDRSSLRRWPRLLVVAVAVAVATLTAVAADGLGPEPADHHAETTDDLYHRLMDEGRIPEAPVDRLTRRLINEGLIPSATR